VADTSIALAPSVAHASGTATVTASDSLFTAADVGRLVAILHKCGAVRAAATAVSAGQIFISEYNAVPRLYRVIAPGTTAAADMAGTTPDYDLNAPNETGLNVLDGSAVLRYLGPGRHVWGWARITAYTNATTVTVAIDPRAPFGNTYASLRWRLGEFGGGRGYPACGTFHRGRLWLAGTPATPSGIWASQVGDFENFGPTEPDGSVLATNGIAASLDADEVETVRWLVSAPRGLVAGTASGEWLIAGANRQAALAPDNIEAARQGDRGTGPTGTPVRAGGAVIFPQRGERRLREMAYDFAGDRFASPDLASLSDDIAAEGFTALAHADVPDGALHALRSDGRIATLTYDPEQRMRAWTIDELGGDGVVESICAVPDAAGTGTDLYCVVARTVDEVTTRTIEVIGAPFRGDLEGQDAGFFVDSGLTYSGAAVTSVTGLAHLNGREVAICADGSMRQAQTVSGGTVAISGTAARTVHVGLAYRSTVIDLPPAIDTQAGPLQGMAQRLVGVTLRLHETGLIHVGGPGERTTEVQFRTTADAIGEAVPLFTGERDVTTFADWGPTAQVRITTTAPLPMTVLAIVKKVEANDR
jgi:hypothetical protein